MKHKTDNYKKLVERELKRIFTSLKGTNVPNVLYDAMHYSVFSGGKRIRPILCLTTYDAIRNSRAVREEILPFACGLEFIHTFSLIQDDLPSMDNDDFRRGKPSLHKAYNEAVALLAADALFAMAFELFTKAKVKDDIKVRTIFELSRICGIQGLAAGQMMDIVDRGPRTANREPLIDEKKTAVLISGSMKIGAIVAGTSERIITQIEKAGIYLGLLFQKTDDILDSWTADRGPRTAMCNKYAQKAKTIFNKIGDNFADLVVLTDKILNRTEPRIYS